MATTEDRVAALEVTVATMGKQLEAVRPGAAGAREPRPGAVADGTRDIAPRPDTQQRATARYACCPIRLAGAGIPRAN